jgi:hypothetical protein
MLAGGTSMAERPKRETVDLSQYPDLVVIYLGMRVNALTGFRMLLGIGPQITKSVEAKPKGLLLHENMLYSPRHVGMRQYWADFESLEAWSRSDPHRQWWQKFLRDSGGTGFWHEAYFRRGGMEAVYIDMLSRIGMARFAPVVQARGATFSARHRVGRPGESSERPATTEEEFYSR